MHDVKVYLEFDKMITSLAGNRLGREVYKKQIADKMTRILFFSKNATTYMEIKLLN